MRPGFERSIVLTAGLSWACGGGPADDSSTGATTVPATADTGASGDSTTDSGATSTVSGDGDVSTGDGDGDVSTGDGDGDGAAAICARWNADIADLSEGTWSGAVASCDPGDMDPAWRERTLKLVNLQRWLVDLPPVGDDATRNADAQACALLMDANGALSHSPPMSWACYSAAGDAGAGRSNISPYPSVASVGLYMDDPGNETTFGHRRWILSNSLGPIGMGSTDAFSCLYVLSGSGTATAEWTAWPAPGPFPIQAMSQSWSSVDETGWTVQSDTIDMAGANATITVDGAPLAVSTVVLDPGYGSAAAIAIVPQGWSAEAGRTYHVEITGASSPIEYDVMMVDCV